VPGSAGAHHTSRERPATSRAEAGRQPLTRKKQTVDSRVKRGHTQHGQAPPTLAWRGLRDL